MGRRQLIYREDRATGLPRLEDPGQLLTAEQRQALEAHLRENFARLISRGDHTAALPTAGRPAANGGAAQSFRVEVRREGRKRSPTLVLEPVEGEAATDGRGGEPPGGWANAFLIELAERLDRYAGGDGGRRSALDFVLADMRLVLRKRPDVLGLLLFAGYLHAGDAVCRRHGAPRDNGYARAAELLHAAAGGELPEGTLDPLLDAAGIPLEDAAS